jgi:hypothetical protein
MLLTVILDLVHGFNCVILANLLQHRISGVNAHLK